jgi:hypothetical protein
MRGVLMAGPVTFGAQGPLKIKQGMGFGYEPPKQDDNTGGVNADAVVESEDYNPGARGSEATNPRSR